MRSYSNIVSFIFSDNKKESLRKANNRITINSDWVDKKLSYLIGTFPHIGADGLFIEGFIPIPILDEICDLDALRLLLHAYSGYLELENVPLLEFAEERFDPYSKEGRSNRLYPAMTLFSNGRGVIRLSRYERLSCSEYNALLAHEITHVFMKENCLELQNDDENEVFTDLTAIWLGFGNILLRGYETIVWSDTDSIYAKSWKHYSFRIGYVTCQDVALIVSRLAVLKKININISYKEMPCQHADWFSKAKVFNRRNHVTRYFVLNCPNKRCNKRIRVPKDESAILVTCPVCHEHFSLKAGRVIS